MSQLWQDNEGYWHHTEAAMKSANDYKLSTLKFNPLSGSGTILINNDKPINVPIAQEATVGIKFDTNKIPVELIPPIALEEIGKVLAFGKVKYAAHNWKKGISYSRLLGAALRHLLAYMRGEDLDPESKLSHLSHLGCCVVFLLWHERFRKDLDDRSKDPDTQHET